MPTPCSAIQSAKIADGWLSQGVHLNFQPFIISAERVSINDLSIDQTLGKLLKLVINERYIAHNIDENWQFDTDPYNDDAKKIQIHLNFMLISYL